MSISIIFVVIALLLPLIHGFTPTSRTEHIPKYNSIEKL
jgi:peroxiredoxin